MTPEKQIREREDLILAIKEAFAGVSRVDGMSWGQSAEASLEAERWIEENCPKPEELFKGRDITWRQLELEGSEDASEAADEPSPSFHDRDQTWQDLIDDPEWHPGRGRGGFAYLDTNVRRYYLPAAMIRSLRDPEECTVGYALTSIHHTGYRQVLRTAVSEEPETHRLSFKAKWAALDEHQIRCVRRFLEYKLALGQDAFEEFLRDAAGFGASENDLALVREAHLNPWKPARLSWREAWEGSFPDSTGNSNQ